MNIIIDTNITREKKNNFLINQKFYFINDDTHERSFFCSKETLKNLYLFLKSYKQNISEEILKIQLQTEWYLSNIIIPLKRRKEYYKLFSVYGIIGFYKQFYCYRTFISGSDESFSYIKGCIKHNEIK